VEVPLFPGHQKLEELEPLIEKSDYDKLAGPQTFALLNISSQMRSVAKDNLNLLDPRFRVQVWRVFTDRIYFDADESLIEHVAGLDHFEKAPAGLHRFGDGSYKQSKYRKGNLQLSYQRFGGGRVHVDADIDLYRSKVAHLFGEVLVNHLTGSKTDQLKVKSILDKNDVAFIGGFEVYAEV
jgi:hypothetical protein